MDETLSGDVIQSVLKVTVSKPALYTCLASNRHSAGANTVKASARVTVAGKFPPAPQTGSSGLLWAALLRVSSQHWWLQLLGPPAVSGSVPPAPVTPTHTSLTTHTVLRARKEQQHARLHPHTHTGSCLLSFLCLLFHPPDVPSTIFCCFLSLPRRVEVRQEPLGPEF